MGKLVLLFLFFFPHPKYFEIFCLIRFFSFFYLKGYEESFDFD